MRSPKTYFVYIMSNRSKTLYTGVTNSLIRRVREHKAGMGSSFAAKYKLDRLVYFERFEDIRNAIEHERVIKGWLRMKKIALIVSVNSSVEGLESGMVRTPSVSAGGGRCRHTVRFEKYSLSCHPGGVLCREGPVQLAGSA